MDTLTKFYEDHADQIYNFCYWRVRNKSDAEDLTAEAFLRFVRQNGLNREYPKAYLYAICRNLIIDHYRTRKSVTSLDSLLDSGFEPETISNLEQLAELNLVYKNVELLTDDQREAITLRYQQDLDMKTIGRIMEKSEAAVKNLIARGLVQLQEKLNI